MEGKTTLKLENIDIRDFCGSKNSNIDYIKGKFPQLSVTFRGEKMIVQGDKPQREEFIQKMERLLTYYKRYNRISEDVINQSFDSIIYPKKVSESPALEGNTKDPSHILYGKNGAAIKAITSNQMRIVEEIRSNDLLFAIGAAGSGKTYVAIALAVKALKAKEVKRIILTRPAVEAGEKLGYLPGDMKEKLDPYLQPLYDALDDMIPPKRLEELIEDRVIQIAPLAYMRGRTLDNAFVILDEAQNTTYSQLKMFLTRMGKSAKFILTGDTSQIDLPSKALSGLTEVMTKLESIKGISIVEMDSADIVRHKLVKEIVNNLK